jgi:predicted HicB family RNase H-like nuclease
MELSRHVHAIQSDLEAVSALGDDAAAEAARRLSDALASSLQLRLLDFLTEATLTLNDQLPASHVEVRLAGRDAELVVVEHTDADDGAAPAPGDDLSARITLRLPEGLKAQIEVAANLEGTSVNTWIVRALQRGLEPRTRSVRVGRRLSGWADS